jgi:hypothetical protein
LTSGYYDAIWAIISDIIGFWSLAIAANMQPETARFLPTTGRACAESMVPSLFSPPRHRRESSISAAKEWAAADNFLQNSKNSGSRARRGLTGRCGCRPYGLARIST